jgi:hypothetical protein
MSNPAEPEMWRIPMSLQTAIQLDAAIHERNETIVREVLQVPDYPPLPACPECEQQPREVTWTKSLGGESHIDFSCGHQFRVPVWDILTR